MQNLHESIAEISPEKRALLELLLREKGLKPDQVLPIPRRPEADVYPLSFAQQRLWFIDQWHPGNYFYNVPSGLRLHGRLDIQALEGSLNEIISRHEFCGPASSEIEGVPQQRIYPTVAVYLPFKDLQHLPEADREAEAQRQLLSVAFQPFDLSTDLLIRSLLVRLAPEEHILLLCIHHIVTDGWSMGVLIKELMALYETERRGLPSPLKPLRIQYADFALWQRDWLQGERLERQLSYWREQFKDGVPVLDLPTDHARPAVRSYRGAQLGFTLDAELTQRLKALGLAEGATLFMVLLAGWQTLLGRLSGADEVVVGADMASRNRAETEELIGFFINMLALKTDLRGKPGFRELVGRVREACLGAYAHQDVPYEKLSTNCRPGEIWIRAAVPGSDGLTECADAGAGVEGSAGD